jgi:DNA-binding IscR family transcriptional regulator
MLLNAETDYAIRIVAYLADMGERCDAKTISESQGVPLRFCLKILNRLVSFDIVKSFKGSKGGKSGFSQEGAKRKSTLSFGTYLGNSLKDK